jgi:hypothetical protein
MVQKMTLIGQSIDSIVKGIKSYGKIAVVVGIGSIVITGAVLGGTSRSLDRQWLSDH